MWDPRAALDTIVQSSTVDLFHACSVAVAPLPRTTATRKVVDRDRVVGMISFSSTSMTGSATLSVPNAVFELAISSIQRKPSGSDWIREQTNQLLGRIKKRLTQFQVTLQTGLPSLPTPQRVQRLEAGDSQVSVYEFRTLRGEVIVTLDANIDYSALLYSGALKLPSEGDIILF
ncbi:MAG TPA: hypothetical protein VG937_15150 [Polyangiaceae bacterium]|nr:hypothetical protein [Polyangiaceae bacterium]